MKCQVVREALSARTDGEREPVPAARVDEHLADCADCRAWHTRAAEQAQLLRPLARRLQPVPLRLPAELTPRRTRTFPAWQRLALGAVGVIELAVSVAQGIGADLAMPAPHRGPVTAGLLFNWSIAWSAALGLVMVVAALRPRCSPGLAAVLVTFAALLTGFVIAGTAAGAMTLALLTGYLPVLAGAVLAVVTCRHPRPPGPGSGSDTRPVLADIVLPDNACRGRRSHLHSVDSSAA